MNPFQHSNVAGEIYKLIAEEMIGEWADQDDAGDAAIRIANMLEDKFKINLGRHQRRARK